jgi:7,8-dihydroneopterin aldolase/epimerase/oxygenase
VVCSGSDHRLRIFVEGLKLQANIGVHAHEHGRKQNLIFDVEMELAPLLDDAIESTLDYDFVANLVERILDQGHIQLVETVAGRVIEALGALPMVRHATVRVRKPSAHGKAQTAGAIWTASFRASRDQK